MIEIPTITITGDKTQEALEDILIKCIGKHGKEFNVQISEKLRFENQNKEIKKLENENTELREEISRLKDN